MADVGAAEASRLQILHVTLFTAGIVVTFFGVVGFAALGVTLLLAEPSPPADPVHHARACSESPPWSPVTTACPFGRSA